MIAGLWLPGDLPGLLRRGSPAWWRDEMTPYIVLWIGPWPDAKAAEDPSRIVLAAPCASPCLGIEDTAANFALDLTDATGRVHAAWWLLRCDADRLPPMVVVDGHHRSAGWILRMLGRIFDEGGDEHDARVLRAACLHVAGRTE